MGKKQRFSAQVEQSPRSVQLDSRRNSKREESFKYLEIEEIKRLFSVIKSKRDRAIFRVSYHRGLRAHEVGLLQMRDFKDRDGVLYVRRGKGSISRQHSLCDEELRCLRAWVKERGTNPGPLFPSRQKRRSSSPLKRSPADDPDAARLTLGIGRVRLDQLMKRYCRLARIAPDKAHMHALKHSCGTHLAERGESAAAIQHWLGHRDSSSTEIYLHFSARRRDELVERHRDWI
jgi:integrase